MSESTKSGGAAADKSGAQTGAENQQQKTVNFEDHDRALKDLHKYKSSNKELQDKLAALENDKLMAEGKKDELIQTLNKQVTELKTKHADMQKNFAWDKVNGWLKTKAVSGGVIQDGGAVDKFVSLVNFKGRNPFRDEQSFELEESVLGQVFEDAKKEMPFFFSKPSPNVRDTTPPNGAIENSGDGNDYSKMSLDQIRTKARELSPKNQ